MPKETAPSQFQNLEELRSAFPNIPREDIPRLDKLTTKEHMERLNKTLAQIESLKIREALLKDVYAAFALTLETKEKG